MITSVDIARTPPATDSLGVPVALPVTAGREPATRAGPAADRPPAGCLIPPVRDGRLGRMGLSERDRAILEFEGSWWTEPGTKQAAIKARLGLSASRYRQILASLVDSDEAALVAPLVIRRLRRERDRRRRARFEGRPAGGRRTF